MSQTDYSEEYIDNVFYLWYQNDKEMGKGFINSLPENRVGRKPSSITIGEWIKKFGWMERADALDAEISVKKDEEIITKRMEMFKKHAEIGETLINRGMEFLNERGITSDQAAIRAIDLGIDTQRISVGMAEAYFKISKMSDDDLQKELLKLTGKVKPDEDNIIDATVTEKE